MQSIYHFFKHLVENKRLLLEVKNLSDFPFEEQMLSCRNEGQFPDLAIKINSSDELFTGGELVELKDSKSYSVSSFNSTIPTGQKEISKVIKGQNSVIKKQMEKAGDDIFSLPVRDVFYLIRGKSEGKAKVALAHGSFFETLNVNKLISQSFEQALEERLKAKGLKIDEGIKRLLIEIFSEQDSFSKVRSVEKASVKLRFRIMTEVKAEGNILNSQKYPEIKDNTINLVVPAHSKEEENLALQRFKSVYNASEVERFKIFKIKHLLNGEFIVFQQAF